MDSSVLITALKKQLEGSTRERLLINRGEEELREMNLWLSREDFSDEEISGDACFSINEMIRRCDRCSMGEEKKYSVGTGKNGVMIVLNPPQLLNRVEKEIFKKDSADMLKKILSAIELELEKSYITSLVKCNIDDPLVKIHQVVPHCLDLLRTEIECISPSLVIIFGDIIPLQKIIKESGSITWYNVDHPITMIKNPDLKKAAWHTLKIIRDKIREERDR